MLLLLWILFSPGVLASSGARLVPWPSWIGAWLADAANDTLPEDRQCVADSRLVMEHFRNHTAWAARMLDASSAGPSTGLLRGVTDSLGDFDECLGLGWPHAAAAPVEPQYCLVTMRTAPFRAPTGKGATAWATAEHLGPFADVQAMMQGRGQHRAVVPLGRLRFGVCLPASCAPAAVARAARRHLRGTDPATDLHWAVEVEDPRMCTRRQHVMQGGATRRLLGGVSVFIGLLVIIGTILDPQGTADLKKSSGVGALSAFSAWRHWRDLTKPMGHGMIAGLAGYKTMFCIIVIAFHHFLLQEGLAVGANSFASSADGSAPALLILMQDCIHNGMVHFFFLSGYLMVRAGRAARLQAPLERAVRFMPLLALTTLVQALVLPYLGSGPAWRWRMELERDDCRANWWRTLLFVNNYGPSGAPTCVIQLWSVAVDVQCFTVCQLAMWSWSQWHRRAAKSIQEDNGKSGSSLRASQREMRGALLALAVTVALRVGTTVYNEWPLVLLMDHTSCARLENAPQLFLPYVPVTIHLLSYVFGGVTAVFFRRLHRDSDSAKFSETLAHVLVPAVFLLAAVRARLSYEAWRDAVHLGPLLDAVAATLRQTASCLFTAVHVAMLEPRITRPNLWQRLAGCRVAVMLSRLTPIVFLLHMMPIMVTLLSTRGRVSQAPLSLLSDAAVLVVQSFLLALVVQLAVVGPLSSLGSSWARPRIGASKAEASKAS